MMDYHTVGLTGFINLCMLLCIVIYRWIIHYIEFKDKSKICKRNFTFAFLLLASAVDLPMYISFFTVHKYDLFTFGFHKLQSAAMFGAYSLTISDWNSVLFEIQEDTLRPFLCRNYSLIAINVILGAISLVNFAYCYSFPDLNTYANSNVYVLGVFIQIIAPLILTISMLVAGIKLSLRIQGASRSINKNAAESPQFREFKSAVFHLNIVMSSVCVAITIQVTLLILNYALGYHNDPDRSVGPELFFWTFVEWLPVWVLTLAQLYLLRTNPNSKPSALSKPKISSDFTHVSSSAVGDIINTGHGNRIRVNPKSSIPASTNNSNHNNNSNQVNDANDDRDTDVNSPLLRTETFPRESFSSSLHSSVPTENDIAFPRSSTYNGDLEDGDSRVFDHSALSAVYMSPQANFLSDCSMSPSDFLNHVRLSHYPSLVSPAPTTHIPVHVPKKTPSPAPGKFGSFSAEATSMGNIKFGSFSGDH